MEKRIKALYIITIAAIIGFLAMQFFWLNTRYEGALQDYEKDLAAGTQKAFDEYAEIRVRDNRGKSKLTRNHNQYTSQLNLRMGDTTRRTATVRRWQTNAYELLGVPDTMKLTDEMMDEVARRITDLSNRSETATDSLVFDGSSAPNENAVWAAAQHVQTEIDGPFTVEGLDSCLAKVGIRADVTLCVTDSMIWHSVAERQGSRFRPTAVFIYPYSELQCKSVRIECPISIWDILPGMATQLIVTLLISALLILCVIWQLATVKKLNRIGRIRSSFVTTMIHELKRPLSTLKMCVSGLDNPKMKADPDTRGELVGEIRTALDNLSAYFSRLRDITFNNVDQIPLKIEGVNLHDIFDNVAKSIPVSSEKTVCYVNNIPADTTISADREHLVNIITNLVENAVKYSGPQVTISAEATSDADGVELRIADTGNGIPSSDLDRIFNRFYRGRAASTDTPGMGLGLSYVRLLVKAHGGEITVASREGEGSCFTLKIPQG